VELYLYAADSELVKTDSLVSLLQLLETRRWRRFFFQCTIWRWVCSLSRYLRLSQFKKSLGCAAPRGIPVTETEEKLAVDDPGLIYRRESRACIPEQTQASRGAWISWKKAEIRSFFFFFFFFIPIHKKSY